jgi:dTDP-4-dehydrorhamnose 3,5-epimerase
MECIERRIGGVFEIILKTFEDARGFFMRSYDAKIFEEVGIERRWVQENHSLSLKQGTLRGLHFQFPPHCEAKLVRVIKGAILDVVLDLRKESETFGQWDFLELSSENKKLLFIPRGFAHGFCTLTDGCEVVYKVIQRSA